MELLGNASVNVNRGIILPPFLKPVEHLGFDSPAKEQVERFIGKKLRCEGQGCIGKA